MLDHRDVLVSAGMLDSIGWNRSEKARGAVLHLWQIACGPWVTLGVASPTSTWSGQTRGCHRAYIGDEGQIPSISWRIASQCVPFQ